MDQTTRTQRDKLMQDLRVVVSDAEELLKASGEQIGDGASEWRNRTQDRLSELGRQLSSFQQQTGEKVIAAGRSTQDFVQRNPWTAVGMASGIGLLAGYLLHSRR